MGSKLLAMNRIVLFAKRPRPGHVKTRLTPPLSTDQALRLYRAFLADQIAQLIRFHPRAEVELAMDGEWEFAEDEAPACVVQRSLQGDGDLGTRMARRFRAAFDSGARRVIALGVDTPTLPDLHVERALAELERHDAVVGPAEDGGYTLIGQSAHHPCLFERIPWGLDGVLKATRERARTHGLSLHELPPWFDVDDSTGLDRLRQGLRDRAHADRAPATARCLATL